MLSPPDSVSAGIMFLGCPVVLFVRPSVHPFVWTDIVATICHECLDQFW